MAIIFIFDSFHYFCSELLFDPKKYIFEGISKNTTDPTREFLIAQIHFLYLPEQRSYIFSNTIITP